jgi:tRNA1(Val) A37 N6-methylase TrmN6
MRHIDLPHLNLHSDSFEELTGFPEVEATKILDDGFRIDLEESNLYLYNPRDPQNQLENLPENIDRVLIPVKNGLLEFDGGTSLYYESSESESLEELIEGIVTRQTKSEEVGFDEALEVLIDSGYVAGFTSEAVAEILAGWAVSQSDDSVLDIATGTGSLLKQAAHENEDAELIGIEINPIIAKLAQTRLKDSDNAEILNTDFFDWNQSGQQELSDDGSKKFDAVIGNPPVGQLNRILSEQREEIRERYPGIGRTAAAAFVAKAVTHLKEGGSGAFVLTKHALKDGLVEYLTETCSIHRIVELPIGTFNYARAPELVFLTLSKEERAEDVRETGVARFNKPELPDNARGLFEQPLEKILQNRYNPYDVEIVRASHADLQDGNVIQILSNPPIYDVISSEQFTRLGELPGITVGSGVRTGDNEFFYFDVEEKEESSIDNRFFRPLIKNPSDDIRSITEDEIDLWILDLQTYIDEKGEQGIEITEDSIAEQLEDDGYGELAEYLQTKNINERRRGSYFLPQYRGKIDDPDMVIPEFFDTPRCYSVEVDNALYDSTVIGVKAGDQMVDNLVRLLNTPLYQEFFQTFASTMNLDWYRMNIGHLNDIPIVRTALSQDVHDRMEPFFPPDDDNDLVNLNHILIESCETEEEKQALRRYLASREEFAWSWFMSLSEFEEFQKLLESDRSQAEEFVIEQFDQELLDQARNTFRNIGFFEERGEFLDDLLMEFEQEHYRGFLAGIVLQFEGVLSDLVEEAGGKIEEENGETVFELPREKHSPTRKNLDNLISQFFDGVFGEYLDATVRQRRNKIAHGKVIENDRELSIQFFVSFYALCNACLNAYIEEVQKDPTTPA